MEYYILGTAGSTVKYNGQTYTLAEDIYFDYEPNEDPDYPTHISLSAALACDGYKDMCWSFWGTESDLDKWIDSKNFEQNIDGIIETEVW